MVRIPTVSAGARIDEERPRHRTPSAPLRVIPTHTVPSWTPAHRRQSNYYIPYNPCILPSPL
ncbi:hypothetical protein BJV78DRAFT_1236169 [Lactifluus subvellereus]|nr:hypothetical protein BJV78DRAFT_1236169 [Lactifluus subvellereus]